MAAARLTQQRDRRPAQAEALRKPKRHEHNKTASSSDYSSAESSPSSTSSDEEVVFKRGTAHTRGDLHRREKFADFVEILRLADESGFFMAPRVLDLCRKPKTFVPPIESRQSREPF